MCPVKTENLSRNVPREEGQFWRDLVRELHVKSRGNLENFLLLEGLKAVNRRAAKRLAALRAEISPRVLGSAALLALFLMTMTEHEQLRVARRSVRAEQVEANNL